MKNISLILASALSIAFTIPVVDKAISKPTVVKGDRLPKIGFIKDTDSGAGCHYSIDKSPNLVLQRFLGAKAVMNFDGKDVALEVISDEDSFYKHNDYKKVKVYKETYKRGNIQVIMLTSIDKSVKIAGFHFKGTIEISNGKRTKTIKIRGVCGD